MTNGDIQPQKIAQPTQAQLVVHDIAPGREIGYFSGTGQREGVSTAGGVYYSISGQSEDILFRSPAEAQAYAQTKGMAITSQVGVSDISSAEYWQAKTAREEAAKAAYGGIRPEGALTPIGEAMSGTQLKMKQEFLQSKTAQWGSEEQFRQSAEQVGRLVPVNAQARIVTPEYKTAEQALYEAGRSDIQRLQEKGFDVSGLTGSYNPATGRFETYTYPSYPRITPRETIFGFEKPKAEEPRLITQPVYDFTRNISKLGEEYANKLFAVTPYDIAAGKAREKEFESRAFKEISGVPELGATLVLGYEGILRDVYGGKGGVVAGRIATGAGLIASEFSTGLRTDPLGTLESLAIQAAIFEGFGRVSSLKPSGIKLPEIFSKSPIKTPEFSYLPKEEQATILRGEVVKAIQQPQKIEVFSRTTPKPTEYSYLSPAERSEVLRNELVSSIRPQTKGIQIFEREPAKTPEFSYLSKAEQEAIQRQELITSIRGKGKLFTPSPAKTPEFSFLPKEEQEAILRGQIIESIRGKGGLFSPSPIKSPEFGYLPVGIKAATERTELIEMSGLTVLQKDVAKLKIGEPIKLYSGLSKEVIEPRKKPYDYLSEFQKARRTPEIGKGGLGLGIFGLGVGAVIGAIPSEILNSRTFEGLTQADRTLNLNMSALITTSGETTRTAEALGLAQSTAQIQTQEQQQTQIQKEIQKEIEKITPTEGGGFRDIDTGKFKIRLFPDERKRRKAKPKLKKEKGIYREYINPIIEPLGKIPDIKRDFENISRAITGKKLKKTIQLGRYKRTRY